LVEGEHLPGENAEELMAVTTGTVGSRMQQKRYEVVRGPLTKTGSAGVLK
jgi:hypothetical protein